MAASFASKGTIWIQTIFGESPQPVDREYQEYMDEWTGASFAGPPHADHEYAATSFMDPLLLKDSIDGSYFGSFDAPQNLCK